MKFGEIWKAFAPSYIASIMAAIFLTLILEKDFVSILGVTIFTWFIVLFFLGLCFTWLATKGLD